MHLDPMSLDIILEKWSWKAFGINLGTLFTKVCPKPYGGNLKDFEKLGLLDWMLV